MRLHWPKCLPWIIFKISDQGNSRFMPKNYVKTSLLQIMNIICQKSIFNTTNSFTSPRILFSLLCTQINYIFDMSLSKKYQRNLSETVDKFVHFLWVPILTDVSWFVWMVINAIPETPIYGLNQNYQRFVTKLKNSNSGLL